MPRPGLPHHLRGRAFKSSDDAFHGTSRAQLRQSGAAHPFHGVSSIGFPISSVHDRCEAYLPLMAEGHCFSHVTAALLFGIPLPSRWERDPRLHVSVLGAATRPRTKGIVGHELTAGDVLVGTHAGLPVIGPADTWFHLAAFLSREDLVAAGDYLLTGRRHGPHPLAPLCSLDDLAAARVRHRGRRGLARAEWAAPRLRWPVDSRPESRMRLLLEAAGFPELLVNDPTPVDGGTAVLHPDLKWPELRIVFEYEGDGHREDAARFRSDIRRRERFEAAMWRVIRVVSDDVFADPGGFVARVRRIAAQQRRALALGPPPETSFLASEVYGLRRQK